ncbi:MAG TPA: tetratricopeptide repeat protein [Sorangium sp.]|nr:tetratricopeptide repeat protein [Sorangium sp.]
MTIPRALARSAAAIVFVFPLGALAQPDDRTSEADARFRRGVELYKEADYGAALTEFRRAYALAPAYQVLYNVAGACYQLRDYAYALRAFERYLTDGGAQIAADRRGEVQKDIAVLRGRVATVAVSTSVPDVEIAVDDVAAGRTPLSEPLLMSAGRRRIVAAAPGRPAVTRVIDVAGGDQVALQIEIPGAPPLQAAVPGPRPGAASPPEQPGAPIDRSPRRELRVPVLPWIATGALAAGAAVTGVLALGASSDLGAALGAFPGDARAIERERTRTATLALTADLLAGAAVLVGGVSLYLTVAGGGGAERAGAARRSSPSIRAAIAPSSLRLLCTF